MTVEIDARGLRCPWPAIRLARAMRDGEAGDDYVIRADDPAAPAEIERVATVAGAAFERRDVTTFHVRR